MTASPRSRIRPLLIVFATTAAFYGMLGAAVSHVPPAGIDAAARAIAGQAPRVAWIFTSSCLWPTLTVLGLIGLVAAYVSPAWRGRITFAIVTTLVTWQVSNGLKDVFRRPRPAYWFVHHETSYAYSSGHAMFAVLVYWLWAYYLARSDLPRGVRVAGAVLLAAWGAGVIWSRLALGAHYPSDLLGGLLLAFSMLALSATVFLTVRPQVRIS